MQAMFPNRHRKQARLAAVLFIPAAILLLAGFVLHPEETPVPEDQVAIIHDNAGAWALSHWVLAAGGALFAAACFQMARARYGPTRFPAGRAAFIALGVSAVLALDVFVLEATLAVAAAKDSDVAAYEALLVPEIPGLLGLFGLGVAGAWAFVTQARDDCPVLPKSVNYGAAAGAALGVVGSVGFLLGNASLALLQYGTALFILGVLAFGVKAAVEARERKAPAAPAAAKTRVG